MHYERSEPSASRQRGSRKREGLTLIELTVVVAILAILAAMLVPRLAFIRTMSMYANEATSIQDTMQNLLTYHATQAVWPDHFDSLLDSSGSLYGYGTTTNSSGLDINLSGLLTATQLTANQYKSLSGLLGQPQGSSPATVTVMDHDYVSKPSNSGTIARLLASGGAVATINYTSTLSAPFDPNAASAYVIYNTVYPNGNNPNNETLIAMGVGPNCLAVNKTIVTPPQLYMKDETRYGRTIILIRVRPDGVQASLAGALSPDGRTLDQCLGNYRVTAER